MASSRIAPPQPFHRFTRTASSITEDAELVIEELRQAHEKVIHNVNVLSTSLNAVLLPFVHARNIVLRQSRIFDIYHNLSPDRELRDAAANALKLIQDFENEQFQEQHLFDLLDAVMKQDEQLDPESRTFLEMQHRSFVRNGTHLPVPQRQWLHNLRQRMKDLYVDMHNVPEDQSFGVLFHPDELHGVPHDALSRFEKGRGENEGKLKVPYQPFAIVAVMQHAESEETRKRYFESWPQLPQRKEDLFREIVLLRDEAARLLGYHNNAEYQIEERVAKTPANVTNFLASLREGLFLGGVKEIERLRDLKESHLKTLGQFWDGNFYAWDRWYYENMLLKKEYSVDQEKIAPYYPLPQTLTGMLDIFSGIFGLSFDEISPSERGTDAVWHEDVQLFRAWDRSDLGGAFLGYLYIDLYQRDGKYNGVANFNVEPGYTRPDGSRYYPSTALICNFDYPQSAKPFLLYQQDFVTLFHELGHAVHDLVSKTRYACCHGPPATPVDFGEAPSQMLENWCWTAETLQALSKHWSYISPECLEAWKQEATPEEQAARPPPQLPEEVVQKLITTRYVNGALFQLVVLRRSIFDMLIHQPESPEALRQMDFAAEWARLGRELTPPGEVGREGAAHLRDNGFLKIPQFVNDGDYDAGYYSYLYSQMFADDMFQTAFRADPMNAEKGLQYRRAVLERGGAENGYKLVERFLGREPKPDAFYKALGIL